MGFDYEKVEKAWGKPKNTVLDELENDLINYFKREYPDRKLENYNLKNCTYDYALVILGKIQELKKELV